MSWNPDTQNNKLTVDDIIAIAADNGIHVTRHKPASVEWAKYGPVFVANQTHLSGDQDALLAALVDPHSNYRLSYQG